MPLEGPVAANGRGIVRLAVLAVPAPKPAKLPRLHAVEAARVAPLIYVASSTHHVVSEDLDGLERAVSQRTPADQANQLSLTEFRLHGLLPGAVAADALSLRSDAGVWGVGDRDEPQGRVADSFPPEPRQLPVGGSPRFLQPEVGDLNPVIGLS